MVLTELILSGALTTQLTFQNVAAAIAVFPGFETRKLSSPESVYADLKTADAAHISEDGFTKPLQHVIVD
jgi:hypothetical protein